MSKNRKNDEMICENPEMDELLELADKVIYKLEKMKQQDKTTLLAERYITDAKLTALLHVSSRTTQKWRSGGLLSYIQLGGGKVLYPISSVEEMLNRCYHPAWAA